MAPEAPVALAVPEAPTAPATYRQRRWRRQRRQGCRRRQRCRRRWRRRCHRRRRNQKVFHGSRLAIMIMMTVMREGLGNPDVRTEKITHEEDSTGQKNSPRRQHKSRHGHLGQGTVGGKARSEPATCSMLDLVGHVLGHVFCQAWWSMLRRETAKLERHREAATRAAQPLTALIGN